MTARPLRYEKLKNTSAHVWNVSSKWTLESVHIQVHTLQYHAASSCQSKMSNVPLQPAKTKRSISDMSPKNVFLPFNNKQTTHNTCKNLLTLFLTTQKDVKMWPGAHSVIHLWTELCIISIAMEQENIAS